VQNVVTITKGAGNSFTFDAAANGSDLTIQFFKLSQYSVTLSTRNTTNIGSQSITEGLGVTGGFVAPKIGALLGAMAVTNTGGDAQFHAGSPSGFSSYLSFRENGVADRGILGYQNGTSYMQIRVNGATTMANGTFSTAFFSTGNVGIGTTTDVASAQLQMSSTTQGFLPPRMTTTQKNAIATPATGLMVYDTTLNLMALYNGTVWTTL
jgi:hypothetical protein